MERRGERGGGAVSAEGRERAEGGAGGWVDWRVRVLRGRVCAVGREGRDEERLLRVRGGGVGEGQMADGGGGEVVAGFGEGGEAGERDVLGL